MSGRALVVNAYSARNLGDAAITLSTAALLRDLGFSAVSVSSRHYDEDAAFYARHSITTVPPLISFPVGGNERAEASLRARHLDREGLSRQRRASRARGV